ncbi:equilibrative nucleobase transporter 1-like [Ylistrum balloti]|uniref:equilibrative nucleobase transporter 1-like n=1 Tax=Ylistrum balloti TaxID=509963 RepID=UPI002905A3B0|nr:equilibrative nucleobase transporter 1-like [Ylistrum balloti]
MAVSSVRIAILILLSLLEILLFGGIQYGWPSLLYILKQEHFFEELCIEGNNVTSGNGTYEVSNADCLSQDEIFNLIFSVGIVIFTVICVVMGHMYFKFGVKRVRTLSIFVLVAGVLCFGFTSPEFPWLVLPGIVFVGVAGISLIISNMQVAVLVPKGSSVYVGLLNGCFDSSVVTQMVVKALYENGISRMYSYISVAVLCVVISGFCTILHPGSKKKAADSANACDDVDTVENTARLPEGSVNAAFKNDENNLKGQPQEAATSKEMENDVTTSSVSSDDVTSGSVRSVICSRLYVLHVLWMSVLLLRFYYFIGSINMLMVQILENDGQVSYLTDVMTYTMLGGMISSFIAGQVFEIQNKWFTGTMKTVIPLTVTSCLGILLSSLSFSSSGTVLYVDFVVLTFFRSFVFSCNMDFVITSFPKKFMSVLFGLVISVSGVLSMTQYALFIWTRRYDNAMTHVNIFLLCLSVISLLHPFLIFMSQKRGSCHRSENYNSNCSANLKNVVGDSTKL